MLVIFIVIKVVHHGSGPADIAFFINTFTPDGLGNLSGTGRTFERYIMKEWSILFKIDTGSEQHTVERLADTQSFTLLITQDGDMNKFEVPEGVEEAVSGILGSIREACDYMYTIEAY